MDSLLIMSALNSLTQEERDKLKNKLEVEGKGDFEAVKTIAIVDIVDNLQQYKE